MSHGASPDPTELRDPLIAQRVADAMQGLATVSRLRILACLYDAPLAVGELSAAVGMEASAVSHQLRLLRSLGLVAGHRDGKQVIYQLHDDHVGQLLCEAISHVEHLRFGIEAPVDGAAAAVR